MSSPSNERIADLIARIKGFGHGAGYSSDEVLSVLTELLAYREAAKEPVAWISIRNTDGCIELDEPEAKASNPKHWTDAMPVYLTPPLPVVPGQLTKAKLNEIWDEKLDKGARFNDSFREGYEYCRALMLSHSEDTLDMVNSPVIPDGSEYRIADAVELLKLAAPHMLNDENLKDPGGALCGRRRSVPDGWVDNDLANSALVMLGRIDTLDSADDARIEEIKHIIRHLAAAPNQEGK